MAFLDFLFGKKRKSRSFLYGEPERIQQIQRFTPQQQNVLNQLLGGAQQVLPSGIDFLQQILSQDPEMIGKFEAPTRRSFEERTIPSIAERFTGMDAQKSSAFGQQLGEAGKRLEEILASQRAGRGFQGLAGLQGLLGGGLTPSFETLIRPHAPGFLETGGAGLVEKGVSGLGKLFSLLF